MPTRQVLLIGLLLATSGGAAWGDAAAEMTRADQVSMTNVSYHYFVPPRDTFVPVIPSICTHKQAGVLEVVLNPATLGFPFLDVNVPFRGTPGLDSQIAFSTDVPVNACFHIPQADGSTQDVFVRRLWGQMRVRATGFTRPIRSITCGAPRDNVVAFSPIGGDSQNFLNIEVNLGCTPPGLGYTLAVQGFTFNGTMSVAPPVEGRLDHVSIVPSRLCQHADAREAVRTTGTVSLSGRSGPGGLDVALSATGGLRLGTSVVHLAEGDTTARFDVQIPADFGGYGRVAARSHDLEVGADVYVDIDPRPSNDTAECGPPFYLPYIDVVLWPYPYGRGPDPDPVVDILWHLLESVNPAIKPEVAPGNELSPKQLQQKALPVR
jgi:hypothetical protein